MCVITADEQAGTLPYGVCTHVREETHILYRVPGGVRTRLHTRFTRDAVFTSADI